ncbi:MAG: hypothetical protein NXI32_20475, partial [bacterium]|nr:hypothetical protein [bacterium]
NHPAGGTYCRSRLPSGDLTKGELGPKSWFVPHDGCSVSEFPTAATNVRSLSADGCILSPRVRLLSGALDGRVGILFWRRLFHRYATIKTTNHLAGGTYQ